MDDPAEGSWLESRRLIISKLSSLETDLRDYGQKVERVLDAMRERQSEAAEKNAQQIAEIRVILAMMEVKVKLWTAIIACAASGAVTVIAQIITKQVGAQ